MCNIFSIDYIEWEGRVIRYVRNGIKWFYIWLLARIRQYTLIHIQILDIEEVFSWYLHTVHSSIWSIDSVSKNVHILASWRVYIALILLLLFYCCCWISCNVNISKQTASSTLGHCHSLFTVYKLGVFKTFSLLLFAVYVSNIYWISK